jgi:hypothetical protein
MDRVISTAARSRDEIIDDIIKKLGGAGGESLLPWSDACRWAVVESYIDRLGALRQADDRRRAEADIAKEIDGLLAKLEIKLARPHAPRFNTQILRGIRWMREVCRAQMRGRPPAQRPADHLKRGCAHCAFDLMWGFSDLQPSNTSEGAFFAITALLYEAVTGTYYAEVEVKRACTVVLHHRRP